jgi:cell division protein FtsQ
VASGERAGRGQGPRAGGGPLGGSPPRKLGSARAASVVVPFPRRNQGGRLDLGWLAPSARSLLVAFALLAGAVLCYVGARETSVFAVQRVTIEGASPAITRQVERALAHTDGESLLTVDLDRARTAVQSVPWIAFASFDRAFPHTLAVRVVQERPVAVIRQGAAAFVVSARGRIVSIATPGRRPGLARIWVPRRAGELHPGVTVTGDLRTAVKAVTPLAGRRFPSRVVSVETTDHSLTLRLHSGLEVQLGDASDVALKLLVARRVIPLLRPGSRYLDVSVPERPVAGTTLEPTLDSQLEVDGSVSTNA